VQRKPYSDENRAATPNRHGKRLISCGTGGATSRRFSQRSACGSAPGRDPSISRNIRHLPRRSAPRRHADRQPKLDAIADTARGFNSNWSRHTRPPRPAWHYPFG